MVTQRPNPKRPRAITALGFVQTLAAAGIIEAESINSIHRVTIVVDPRDMVTINVEYIADERLVDLVGGWADVQQSYEDQLEGRRARLLREELAREEEAALTEAAHAGSMEEPEGREHPSE